MMYAVKCPMLGTLAIFAMIGDAEEWKEFYETKYPVMKDMYIEEEKWENKNS